MEKDGFEGLAESSGTKSTGRNKTKGVIMLADVAQKEQKHEAWCASLTQMLLINPPKPAPCNCKTKLPEPEQVADAMLKEKNQ